MKPKRLFKTESTTKMLARRLGGKWKNVCGGWECDDGIRTVNRVLTGRDMNGEYDGMTALCLYFKDGRSPEWL